MLLVNAMHDRITTQEAAKMLGVSAQFVRLGIRSGRLPIGTAVKMSSVWCYHISRNKLIAYLEMKEGESNLGT